jgi:hypothetical protein
MIEAEHVTAPPDEAGRLAGELGRIREQLDALARRAAAALGSGEGPALAGLSAGELRVLLAAADEYARAHDDFTRSRGMG